LGGWTSSIATEISFQRIKDVAVECCHVVLKSSVTIEDFRGQQVSALPDDQISDSVRTLAQMLRPMFANMLGSFGQHVAIVMFPASDKNGRATVDPTKEGTFVAHVGDVEVRYRLPLGSLLPTTMDPKTGESFPGNFHFNPFTGAKLSPAPVGSIPKVPTTPLSGIN
jgi:hypothetical protein